MSFLPPRPASESAGVVNRFNPNCSDFFLEGTTPNLPGILVDGTVKDQNRYKPICQLFKYMKKKKVYNTYMFATLYDTTNKIPVFSAFTFTGVGPSESRPDTWMIEPQLDGGLDPDMSLENDGVTYTHQAVNQDFHNSVNLTGLNKGHLFSKGYANQPANQNSTFTLTNCVPQVQSFNNGSWGKMECKVRKILLKQCLDNTGKPKAYVVTGAVPSTNNTLNNRVNIPDLMWTAYCCYNKDQGKWVAEAHWGENQGEGKGKTMPSNSMAELYEMLNQHYPDGGVQVFPDQCSTAQRLMDEDVHDHCVYDDDCVCSSVGIKGHYLPVVLFPVLVMRML
ncbi:endonuclease domain-containing 1 protein-like isoform X2 [Coregonus clupeaformis]|uniref:endonuclease domain-containing 1 protein-like isoform X2 n=1 Tax=Coregonus clupeaformis TaxID=59861 RepID=UPI001E1C8C2A|nr:endonuclease domain-containing 1 protein-like isoform X2 [Coregonus clupeaformis]